MERNESAIKQKLFELFMSKNKKPELVIVNFWEAELKPLFAQDIILSAINRMKWDADDFPTLAKIADKCDEVLKDDLMAILKKGGEEAQQICSGMNISYGAMMNTPGALDRRIDDILSHYSHLKAKELEHGQDKLKIT